MLLFSVIVMVFKYLPGFYLFTSFTL
jgi:hypothetical protein